MLTTFDKILLFPLWLLSFIPLPGLYLVADLLYIVSYYILGYRKRVVVENLKNSFPDKTKKEIQQITSKFYRQLCDVFVESFYLLNMSVKELDKRYAITNLEEIKSLHQSGKDVIVATSHYANWEWGAMFNHHMPYDGLAVYRPLSNKLFDRFFCHLRSRFGCKMIPMKQTLREIIQYKRAKKQFGLYLLADQRPGLEDLTHWINFLNQKTPVITGIEKLAKKFDLAVYFMDIKKVKRGKYNLSFVPVSLNPGGEPENKITNAYNQLLEQMILRQPELWLWSHKRWKYKPEDYMRHNA
ncbi:MAG: lysophospholipid acyltransferase family protein [Bacteroidales bacterium]|nr:lysophospholipid acyltransferase family protein [Bacteroidales bacterium]